MVEEELTSQPFEKPTMGATTSQFNEYVPSWFVPITETSRS
jgi:hypothetical protein